MDIIDLHTHTTCSDGLYTPWELIDKAESFGLKGLCIADHDSIKAYGNVEIFEYAEKKGIDLISGVELSTVDETGRKYHILGYLFDLKNKDMIELLDGIYKTRFSYAKNVCEMLSNDGWYIDIQNLLTSGDSITKAHISRALIGDNRNNEKIISTFGHIPNEGELTERFLIRGKKYFTSGGVPLSPLGAIDAIHKAKGVAILAHPAFNVINGENPDELFTRFKTMGIDGIEAINIQFNKSKNDERVDYTEEFSLYAEKNNLIITGGSDYHHSDETLMGNFIDLGFKGDLVCVPFSILTSLKDYKNIKYGKI